MFARDHDLQCTYPRRPATEPRGLQDHVPRAAVDRNYMSFSGDPNPGGAHATDRALLRKHDSEKSEYFGDSSIPAFLHRARSRATLQFPAFVDRAYMTACDLEVSQSVNEGIPQDEERHLWPGMLDAYFASIHPIEPILNERAFRERCKDIDHTSHSPGSLHVLYYAVIGLGCLTSPLQTSTEIQRRNLTRVLYGKTISILNDLGTKINIEITQCHYFLVCSSYKKFLSARLGLISPGYASSTPVEYER